MSFLFENTIPPLGVAWRNIAISPVIRVVSVIALVSPLEHPGMKATPILDKIAIRLISRAISIKVGRPGPSVVSNFPPRRARVLLGVA